jgi:hypothetical protein
MKSLIPAFFLVFFCAFLGAVSQAQTAYAMPAAYTYSGAGNGVKSNVPLNEINIHAFRHFSKKYPAISDETWFKTEQGYTVVFTDNSRLNRVFYGVRGNFLCGVSYYPGTEIDKDTGLWINKKFPGYEIGVVTAINDGENTVYLVTIKNNLSVKTLSVCNGIIEMRDDVSLFFFP